MKIKDITYDGGAKINGEPLRFFSCDCDGCKKPSGQGCLKLKPDDSVYKHTGITTPKLFSSLECYLIAGQSLTCVDCDEKHCESRTEEYEHVKYSRPDLLVDTTDLPPPSTPPTGLCMSDDGTDLITDDGRKFENTIPPPPAWVEDYNKCTIHCGKQKNELSKVCPCDEFKEKD